MKRLLLIAIVFLTLTAVFVYPGWKRKPVDCLAGCRGERGVPITWYEFKGGGIMPPNVPYDGETINHLYLLVDLLIWLTVSVASALSIYKVKDLVRIKRREKLVKTVIISTNTKMQISRKNIFIVVFIIILLLLLLGFLPIFKNNSSLLRKCRFNESTRGHDKCFWLWELPEASLYF